MAHVSIVAAFFAFADPGSFQSCGFHDPIYHGRLRPVHHISVLSDVRFFGLPIPGQIEHPRLLYSPGANDLVRLRNDLLCPGCQSAAASIPVKSKPEQQRRFLCNIYGGCVVCPPYPHTGK